MKNEKTSSFCLEQAFKYIEMVTDPYEKAKLYLHASEVLITMESVNPVILSSGTQSIQTENSKVSAPVDTKKFEPVEGNFEDVVEDNTSKVVEQPGAPTVTPPNQAAAVTEETLPNAESSTVEAPTTQAPLSNVIGTDLETNEPLDVTAAYNMLTGEISHEVKITIASRLTSYNCFEPFKKLVNVSDGESKALLADFISQFGYETINKVLYDFNDRTIEMDVFDFINNNNVNAFVNYIDTNWDAINAKYPA